MRVLVTGGAGFIGSHIVDALVADGHSVFVMDDMSAGNRANLNSKAAMYETDIIDAQAVADAFADAKPDVVNHHAAQISVRNSMSDPAHDARINILGSLNVLQACVANGVRRIIFPSTCAVYATPQRLPMPEDHPQRPESIYGASKLSVETFIRLYTDTYGIRHKIFRYGNVYGPRQNPGGEAGVVGIFTGQLSRGEQPTIFGDGTKTRDYIYVQDIVAANIAALTNNGDDETYNLAYGVGISDYEIFDAVRSATGSDMQPTYAPVRPGEADAISIDPSKAQQAFEWQPQVPLADGIAQVVAHYRKTYSHTQ